MRGLILVRFLWQLWIWLKTMPQGLGVVWEWQIDYFLLHLILTCKVKEEQVIIISIQSDLRLSEKSSCTQISNEWKRSFSNLWLLAGKFHRLGGFWQGKIWTTIKSWDIISTRLSLHSRLPTTHSDTPAAPARACFHLIRPHFSHVDRGGAVPRLRTEPVPPTRSVLKFALYNDIVSLWSGHVHHQCNIVRL